MIDLLGSGVTWISGVPLDRSDLRLSRLGVVGQGREDRVVRDRDLRGVLAGDDDVEAVRAEAGGLRDRDVVAVGLHRGERLRERDRVGGQVDVVGEPHEQRGAVGRPAALGGDDGLEAGIALARDGGLDLDDVVVGEEDRLRLDGPVEDGLGAGAGGRRDGHLDRLLAARVDERGRELGDERAGHHEQDDGGAHHAELGPAAAERALDRRRVGPDPERVDGLAVLVDVDLDLVDDQVGEDRHDGQGAQERGQEREGDREREREEELGHDAADEAERQEHADRGDGRRGDRARDLLGAVDRRRRGATSPMARWR